MLTLIVSDLHLAAGVDPQTGKFSPLDDFLADDVFARWLAFYQETERNAHLVLNGDTFDPTQVTALPSDDQVAAVTGQARLDADQRRYGLRHSPREVCWKLRRIAQGHPAFFVALARWVRHAHHIHVIVGNHDIELRYPEVQEEFLRCVAQSIPGLYPDTVRSHIRFYDSYLYQPQQQLYVEHGGQYDSFSSADNGHHPASHFTTRYLFNHLEARTPEADNIFPFTRYLAWQLSTDTLWAVTMLLFRLPDYVRGLWRGEHRLPAGTPPLCRLPAQAEARIAQAAQDQRRRLARIGHRTALLTLAAVLLNVASHIAPLGIVLLALHDHWFLAALTLIAWPLTRTIGRSISYNHLHRSLIREHDFLCESAAQFAPTLAEQQIKTMVFGHTHQPDQAVLSAGLTYFNTGTWMPLLADHDRLISEHKRYPFVLVRDGETMLYRWDDALGRPCRPILLETRPHTK